MKCPYTKDCNNCKVYDDRNLCPYYMGIEVNVPIALRATEKRKKRMKMETIQDFLLKNNLDKQLVMSEFDISEQRVNLIMQSLAKQGIIKKVGYHEKQGRGCKSVKWEIVK